MLEKINKFINSYESLIKVSATHPQTEEERRSQQVSLNDLLNVIQELSSEFSNNRDEFLATLKTVLPDSDPVEFNNLFTLGANSQTKDDINLLVRTFTNATTTPFKLFAQTKFRSLAKNPERTLAHLNFLEILLIRSDTTGETKSTFLSYTLANKPEALKNKRRILRNILLKRNLYPNVINSFLNLVDDEGISILDRMRALKDTCPEVYNTIEDLLEPENIPLNVDTHTSSLNVSVRNSILKLTQPLSDRFDIKIEEENKVLKIAKIDEWRIFVNNTFTNSIAKITSLLNDQDNLTRQLTELDSPVKPTPERTEEIKYKLDVVRSLLTDLQNNIAFGTTFPINPTATKNLGLSIQEITAICLHSIFDREQWLNPEFMENYFLNFLLNGAYRAKRGYDIDADENEWRNKELNNHHNRCSDGIINDLLAAMIAHKQVEIKVISLETTLPLFNKSLLSFLTQPATPEFRTQIQAFLINGYINNELQTSIINHFLSDSNLTVGVSEAEIKNFGKKFLDYNLSNFLATTRELFADIVSVSPLPGVFVLNEDHGYMPYFYSKYLSLEETANKEDFFNELRISFTENIIEQIFTLGLLLHIPDTKFHNELISHLPTIILGSAPDGLADNKTLHIVSLLSSILSSQYLFSLIHDKFNVDFTVNTQQFISAENEAFFIQLNQVLAPFPSILEMVMENSILSHAIKTSNHYILKVFKNSEKFAEEIKKDTYARILIENRNFSTEYIEYLLNYGINIYYADNNQNNLLHYATYNVHENLIIALLKKAPELLSMRNSFGKVPMALFPENAIFPAVEDYFEQTNYNNFSEVDKLNLLARYCRIGRPTLTIAKLADQCKNINSPIKNHHTILGIAILNDRADVVAYLLEKGAKLYHNSASLHQPLECLLVRSKTKSATYEVIKSYLERLTDQNEIYHLHKICCSLKGSTEFVSILREKNYNSHKFFNLFCSTPFTIALDTENYELAMWLLERNEPFYLKEVKLDENKLSFLLQYFDTLTDIQKISHIFLSIIKAELHIPELLNKLIEKGADVNYMHVRDKSFSLGYAFDSNNEENVNYLLEHGAKICFESLTQGIQPLSEYRWHNQNITNKIIEFIAKELESKNNLRLLDSIYFCILKSNPSARLLERFMPQCDPNKFFADNTTTPFLIAAEEGNIQTINILLESGADPHQRDALGRNVLYHVINRNFTAIIPTFIQKGVALSHEKYSLSAIYKARIDDIQRNISNIRENNFNFVIRNFLNYYDYFTDENLLNLNREELNKIIFNICSFENENFFANDIELIHYLFNEYGADINYSCPHSGYTIFDTAVLNRNLLLIEYLLSKSPTHIILACLKQKDYSLLATLAHNENTLTNVITSLLKEEAIAPQVISDVFNLQDDLTSNFKLFVLAELIKLENTKYLNIALNSIKQAPSSYEREIIFLIQNKKLFAEKPKEAIYKFFSDNQKEPTIAKLLQQNSGFKQEPDSPGNKTQGVITIASNKSSLFTFSYSNFASIFDSLNKMISAVKKIGFPSILAPKPKEVSLETKKKALIKVCFELIKCIFMMYSKKEAQINKRKASKEDSTLLRNTTSASTPLRRVLQKLDLNNSWSERLTKQRENQRKNQIDTSTISRIGTQS